MPQLQTLEVAMYRVQAWNRMGGKLEDPSAPMEMKQALELALEYRNRGLRRITLIDTVTGEQFTDLEHLMRELPQAQIAPRESSNAKRRP